MRTYLLFIGHVNFLILWFIIEQPQILFSDISNTTWTRIQSSTNTQMIHHLTTPKHKSSFSQTRIEFSRFFRTGSRCKLLERRRVMWGAARGRVPVWGPAPGRACAPRSLGARRAAAAGSRGHHEAATPSSSLQVKLFHEFSEIL